MNLLFMYANCTQCTLIPIPIRQSGELSLSLENLWFVLGLLFASLCGLQRRV